MSKLPLKCSVVGCDSSFNKSIAREKMLFAFPMEPEDRRNKWISFARIGRENGANWLPDKNASICYRHFQKGNPNASPLNVDYVPTIYIPSLKTKADSELEREKKRMKTSHEPLAGTSSMPSLSVQEKTEYCSGGATASASSTTLPTHGTVSMSVDETVEVPDDETMEVEDVIYAVPRNSPEPSTSFDPDFF